MTTATPETKHIPMFEPPGKERRGVGTLEVTGPAGRVALPLARVEIAARVADRVADVTVTETFKNTLTEHLEAVYIFPMPGGAAVSEFELRVGARIVKGGVKERGAARIEYGRAMQEGKRAALLEQERDDIFTVQVGNIPPGEEVAVRIRYSERLAFFDDGTTEIRLPLVVAPRYIPGAPVDRESVGDGTDPDTDIVPDASRISPPRLASGFDPKVALSLEVELLRGAGDGPLDDLACSQHATKTGIGRDGSVKVALAREDEPLDRDFVLRWRLPSADTVLPSLLWHRDGAGGAVGLLSLLPPRRDGFLGLARDVVFVLDRSGSMSGVKMASAARACGLLLRTLGPRDRFAVLAFDNAVEWLDGGRFVAADEAALERGEKFLREVTARGGTEMDQALRAALGAIGRRAEAAGRSPAVVMLTDGDIGDESRVLKTIQTTLGDTRLFSVGIDTAVNEGFLKRMAALGGGTASFVTPGEGLEEALRAIGREIGTPLVVDVEVTDAGAGLDPASLAPERMPDLFAGRAATAFLRAKDAGKLRVRGRFADGGKFEAEVEGREVALPAIAQLWAKARVADLEDRFRVATGHGVGEAIKKDIVDLAVRHSLLTRFTAFVAVDESEVVNKSGTRRKMVQPVEKPARWEMEDDQESIAQAGFTCAEATDPYMAMPACMAPQPPPVSASPAKALSAPREPAAPAGPPMPASAPRSVAAFGGIMGKVADAIGNVLGGGGGSGASGAKKKSGRGGHGGSGDDLARVKDPMPAAPSPDDRRAIEKALKAFDEALVHALAEIAAGRAPRGDALEKARAALLEAVTKSAIAAAVPLLQRLLRTTALELTAALAAPGATAGAVKTVAARAGTAFAEARAEIARVLAGAPAAGTAFWEASV